MKTVKRIIALVPAFALALGACSSNSVNENAASTTYNAPFTGNAQILPINNTLPVTSFPPPVQQATLTLSQLAATVTGTLVLTTSATDTTLRAAVTGHTTSDGLTLTVVQPAGCATTFQGPVALAGDGSLSGRLTGSNCNAAGSENLALVLGPLVRQ